MDETLKTLKDFHVGSLGGFGFPKHPVEGDYVNDRLFRKALRQEAIKHIKKLESDYTTQEKEGMECADCGVDDTLCFIDGQIDWIKNFFNLTEEDIKCEAQRR
jgi:hypothetical protein